MCIQFQDASRSFEAGYDCAKYNDYAKLKLTVDEYHAMACREASRLDEAPPEKIAFKLGFEAFLTANVKQ